VLMENPLFTPTVTLDSGLVRVAWLLLGIPVGLIMLYRTLTSPVTEGTDRAFAILLVSAVLLSPLGWIYYLWLPVGPIAATARAWWIERSIKVGGTSTSIATPSWYLFLASMMGMAVPVPFSTALQPSALATFLIGSIHFCSLLFIWIALMIDRLDLRLLRTQVESVCLANSRGRWTDPALLSGSQ
jgi:hypothetical protein